MSRVVAGWIGAAVRSPAGFTLIEIMVVLAIIGLLVGLVVPRYLGSRKQAYGAEALATISELKALQWSYYQRNGKFADNLDAMGFKPPAGSRWVYEVAEATEDRVVIRATGHAAPLTRSDTVTLTLTAEGEAKVESTF
ncbi:MAG: prepilin-type N-terminal cleavage/methylation domain-containing protein [Armatimonadetes bacterium]|nr:prepilin-type N-terminal cleavage/methylation domain-containing protein [Armatimonadota bacterium]